MLVACSCFATEKYPLSPSKAKVENLTAMRSQIVLNGVWQFAPSYSKTERPNKAEFGRILVPGFWKRGLSVVWKSQPTGKAEKSSSNLKEFITMQAFLLMANMLAKF